MNYLRFLSSKMTCLAVLFLLVQTDRARALGLSQPSEPKAAPTAPKTTIPAKEPRFAQNLPGNVVQVVWVLEETDMATGDMTSVALPLEPGPVTLGPAAAHGVTCWLDDETVNPVFVRGEGYTHTRQLRCHRKPPPAEPGRAARPVAPASPSDTLNVSCFDHDAESASRADWLLENHERRPLVRLRLSCSSP